MLKVLATIFKTHFETFYRSNGELDFEVDSLSLIKGIKFNNISLCFIYCLQGLELFCFGKALVKFIHACKFTINTLL